MWLTYVLLVVAVVLLIFDLGHHLFLILVQGVALCLCGILLAVTLFSRGDTESSLFAILCSAALVVASLVLWLISQFWSLAQDPPPNRSRARLGKIGLAVASFLGWAVFLSTRKYL